MDMTRRAALKTSAAIASSVLFPMRSFGQETPRRGGVFTVHYGAEQRQLNPSLQASTGVYIIGGKIQEQLVDLDAKGQPVGVLAESWEASPDGKTMYVGLGHANHVAFVDVATRSAKLMLRTALLALARHYAPPAPQRRTSHHWGTEGYRPPLSQP